MNRKRILAWLLTLVMIVGMLPAAVFADETDTGAYDAGTVLEEAAEETVDPQIEEAAEQTAAEAVSEEEADAEIAAEAEEVPEEAKEEETAEPVNREEETEGSSAEDVSAEEPAAEETPAAESEEPAAEETPAADPEEPAAEPEEPEAEPDGDGRIEYSGLKVGFFKEDGTSEFGMFSLQDGSRVVLDGDTVRIYDVPSNVTVYDGIHWGFITDENRTKDVPCLPSGRWAISVSADNCGYGIPVAPVKKSDGGTTSAQYYLCLPAKSTLKQIADYSAVDAALAAVPSDLTGYTEASVKAVEEAVAATNAEDFRFYNTEEQDAVDAAAKAVNDAVAALQVIPPVIEEGTYTLPELFSSSAENAQMLNHFEADSRRLIVKGDTATIRFITDGSTASVGKYSKIALGKSSELLTENYQPELPEGTMIVEGIEQAKAGEKGARYLYKITLAKSEAEALLANNIEDDIYVIVWNKAGSSADKIPGWYKASSDLYLSLGKLGEKIDVADTVTVALNAKDNKTGDVIEGVAYTVKDSEGNAVEAVNGVYTLAVDNEYKITAEARGYRTVTENYTAKEEETTHTVGIWPLNNHFWLQVCLAEKQYAESTPASTGRGEVVTIQKEGEEPVVAEPDGSHYTFNYLEAGATYTVKVVWEGHDVIISDEWNVEKHGYYFVTDGTTEWTQTVTMPTVESGEEFFTNLIARFIAHDEGSDELDYTAVDDALDTVPENLRLFTAETADAVRAAVKAVDREAQKQEDVDAMAEAINAAVQGLIPRDGTYEVDFLKYNATPYYLYEGLGDSDRENGKAVLVVENGKMSANVVLKNQSFGQVCLGTKDEVIEAATAAGTVPEGTIDLTMPAEKETYNGKEYLVTKGTIPVAALQTRINYAYHSSNTKYTYNTGWYDHGVLFLAGSLVPIDVEPILNETISLSVYNEEGMFKSVNAFVEIKDGEAELVFALSGTSYDYIYAGTFDEAMANGKNKENWTEHTTADVDWTYTTLDGELHTEGIKNAYQYRVPFETDEDVIIRVPVIAISNSRAAAAEKADPENPDYSSAFTARQFLIDLSMESVVVGNYEDDLDVAVASELETFAVEEEGNLYISGTPAMNEYSCQPTITMRDETYDKAFIGTAEAAAAADESKLIDIEEDLTFVLPFRNSRDAGVKDITDGVAVAAFHSARYDYWIERTFTMDTAARTITISGEELTEPPMEDGTYTAAKISTDVTTDASGMIMVTKATVVIKEGQAYALVTMKGTGADRFYVSDTATKDTIVAEAIAEEQKEVGGEFGALLGGLKLNGESAYSFWPVPIKLGEPKVFAARSASHFAKQDIPAEQYYYVHDFQIDSKDLEKVSDSTELPVTAAEEAQRYLNQYFLDGKVVTAATAPYVTGKNDKVTVPYYQGNTETKISSFIFKMAESEKFRTGWFVDSSILNTTYFSSSNLKKIRYPEGSGGKVTFSPKATYRDEGMTFTATLKLFDASAEYDQYDASGVYYNQEPLAEQTFTFTVEPLPGPRAVTIAVVDSVSKEAIETAVVSVTDAAGTAIEAAEGVYSLMVPGSYTVKASAEGYVVPGSEETEYVQTEYVPKKDGETLTITLIKAEEAKNTIRFFLKDQMGEDVVNPTVSVYTWKDKAAVAAEADGSYKLYRGTLYGYTVTAEGYEETTKTITPAGDETVDVVVNKYLNEQKFTFRVYDNDTNETLEGVTLVVKYGPTGAEESAFVEAAADENGVYTIPIDNRVIAYGSKEGYIDDSLGVWSLGFDPLKECSFGMYKAADYTAVDEAIAKVPADLSIYTEESVKAVTDAIDAVDRNKKASEQAKVDAMAEAIEAAIAALEKKPLPKYTVEFVNNAEDEAITFTVGTVEMTDEGPVPVILKSGDTVEEGGYVGARVVNDSNAIVVLKGFNADGSLIEEWTVVPGDAQGIIVMPLMNAVKFTLDPATVEIEDATLKAASYTFKNRAVKPAVTSVTATINGEKVELVKGTDYTVSYSNNVNVGSNAKVTIKGKGSYTGTITKTFKITKVKLGSAKLKYEFVYWNGSERKQTSTTVVKAKVDGKNIELKNGTDYAITYSNNKNVGIATMKITGKGNYKGTITKKFQIRPKKTSLKSVTSTAAGKITVKWNKQDEQIDKYQIWYSTDKNFGTKSHFDVAKGTYTKTRSGLTKGKTYYVKIRTYKTVDGKKYYSKWSDVVTVKVKK